ncbi:hypothetical protein K7X08_037421 [Anisodus acutangulus]|nr:hypothetical protein K7X08_037421 [Anisodus acutangulus]
MTTNQDADNQGVEARKFLAIKLVREATERILLPEVQDQSSDNQSVTNEVCTEENFKESNTKNESDEGSITRENIGSPEKQKTEGQVTNEAPKYWSNLKRWILLQRFIKELEKLRKFNPRKPRYLELEPDPEEEKVNLKHQTEDERKRTEEWMLDYALQQAISQLAPTQKRKVGLLVTAFETVVPPQRSNIQKLDEVTTTSSDKVSVDGEGKPEVKEEENLKLEPEARINVSKASHEKEKGISFTASKLCNDCDETQENNTIVPSASECDENKKISEAEDEDGTHRKQVNKQNHISMWHMISQHVLSDVVSKVGSDQLLKGTDDEVNDNKKLAEIITDNSPRDISHYGRSFSRNDVVNLIKEAISQIITTPIQDYHSVGGEQSSTNSFCEEKMIPHAKSKLESPKSKNWSKLKKLILIKRSIKALERARKLNPQPPQLFPPTHDQEQEKVDLRHQMTDERKRAEQWMLDNAM